MVAVITRLKFVTVKGPKQTDIRRSEHFDAASAKGFVEDGDYTEKVLVLTCISYKI